MPKMSDKFETTQVLENGTLEVSCEAEGYIIKDEAVCTAEETGTIEYKVDENTVVKKGTTVVSIEAADTDKESEIKGKYQKVLGGLKGFDLLTESQKPNHIVDICGFRQTSLCNAHPRSLADLVLVKVS